MGKKDPAAMQTASGIPKIKEIGTSFLFSEKEKQHLKKLETGRRRLPPCRFKRKRQSCGGHTMI